MRMTRMALVECTDHGGWGIVIQITDKYQNIDAIHANQNLQLLFEFVPLHFHLAIYFYFVYR